MELDRKIILGTLVAISIAGIKGEVKRNEKTIFSDQLSWTDRLGR